MCVCIHVLQYVNAMCMCMRMWPHFGGGRHACLRPARVTYLLTYLLTYFGGGRHACLRPARVSLLGMNTRALDRDVVAVVRELHLPTWCIWCMCMRMCERCMCERCESSTCPHGAYVHTAHVYIWCMCGPCIYMVRMHMSHVHTVRGHMVHVHPVHVHIRCICTCSISGFLSGGSSGATKTCECVSV